MEERHLVVGATGVAGTGIVRQLVGGGGRVFALSRSGRVEPGVAAEGVRADLFDAASVRAAVAATNPTHVYYAAHYFPASNAEVHPRQARRALAWARPFYALVNALPFPTGWAYAPVNRASGLVDAGQNLQMLQNLLGAVEGVQHVAIVTGGRLHGVHLGPALWPAFSSPISEASPVHPGASYYKDMEHLFLTAPGTWTRSIHRPHFIVSAARGAPYSLANILGGYAILCRTAGLPLRFLGGRAGFDTPWDAVDAELIGAQMRWAAHTPAAHGEAFLVSNGSPWRWSERWPALAARYGLAWDVPDQPMALHEHIQDATAVWARVSTLPLSEAMSVLFLHQSMVIDWAVAYGTEKGRRLGFTDTRDHGESLDRALTRLTEAGVLPA